MDHETHTYAELEGLTLSERQTIGLGNDRDQVHKVLELAHKSNIKRLQASLLWVLIMQSCWFIASTRTHDPWAQ